MEELGQIVAAVRQFVTNIPNRDIIVFSRGISRQLYSDISTLIESEKTHENCTLFMTTYGGDPHAGYRIARAIRHHYKHVRVVIPSYCKSAGTLIAICADEIAIGDYGELGPLDIQVSKPTEFQERSSGLDIMQALQVNFNHAQEAFRKCLIDVRNGGRLSTKLAGEFASKMATGIVEPLYAQIDPNRIGELQRAMRIAHEYGERLDAHGCNLKPGALNQLIAGYPSHDFVIDRKEAADRLFSRVSSLSPEEYTLSNTLWGVLEKQMEYGPFIFNGLYQGEQHDNAENNGPGVEQRDSSTAGVEPVQGGAASGEPPHPAENHSE